MYELKRIRDLSLRYVEVGSTGLTAVDSSSLTCWRECISEEKVETLSMVSINVASTVGMMEVSSVERVIVDTAVMPKGITHGISETLKAKVQVKGKA